MKNDSAFALRLAERLDRHTQIERWRRDPVAWVEEYLGEFVWSKQAEVMRSVAANPRVTVQSAHSTGKCVSLDAAITLADGTTVEARELVGRTFVIPSWSEDGSQTPAIARAEHNGVQSLYRITTTSGRTIDRTGNHPLYAAVREGGGTGRRITVTPQGWREVAQLQVGDLVLVPEQLRVEGRVRADDADVKLLGYMLGDGSTTKHIAFTQQEGPAKDEFRKLVAHYGCQTREDHAKYRIIVVGPDGERFHRVASNPVTNRIRAWGLMGCKAIHKRFPEWAWRLPNDQLALLLNRLYACDGWASAPDSETSTNFQIGISLSSHGLLRDVERALLRLGINGVVRERATTYTGADGRRFPSWMLTLTRLEDVRRFRDVVGILGKQHNVERVAETMEARHGRPSRWMRAHAPEGYRWEKITSIASLGEHATVAISVPGPQAYVTSFVEHNSHLASRLVAWFLTVHPPLDTFVVTTAPTAAQVRAILWRYISQVHAKGKLPGRVTQAAEWKIDDQLVAYGRKPSDYSESNFSGIHAKNLLVILDEACGVGKHLWVAADSLATGADSHQLAIGNPDDNASHFATVCTTEPGWVRHKISAFDTPAMTGEPVPQLLLDTLVTEEWIRDKQIRWGESSPLYRAKVLGEFADSEDGLIPLSWVRAANARWHEWNESPTRDSEQPPGRCVFGVDVARFGDDKTAIATRQGDVVMSVETWSKLDTTQTTGLVQARLGGTPQSVAVVDVVGVGAGVVDQLRRAGCNVRAFNGAERTKRRDASGSWKFPNARCAAWYSLREQLDPALGATLALPPDDDLTADLIAPRYEPRAGAQLWVESKSEIKARLGHSPDLGDSVAMACWSDMPAREDSREPLRPIAYANSAGRWA